MSADLDKDLLAGLAERLVTLRKQQGMTQDDLVYASGVTRRMVQGIEREGRNPSVVTLAKLARALKTSASELLAGLP